MTSTPLPSSRIKNSEINLRKRLSPVAAQVDEELAKMDKKIDWLTRLTPVNINAIKSAFIDSG